MTTDWHAGRLGRKINTVCCCTQETGIRFYLIYFESTTVLALWVEICRSCKNTTLKSCENWISNSNQFFSDDPHGYACVDEFELTIPVNESVTYCSCSQLISDSLPSRHVCENRLKGRVQGWDVCNIGNIQTKIHVRIPTCKSTHFSVWMFPEFCQIYPSQEVISLQNNKYEQVAKLSNWSVPGHKWWWLLCLQYWNMAKLKKWITEGCLCREKKTPHL